MTATVAGKIAGESALRRSTVRPAQERRLACRIPDGFPKFVNQATIPIGHARVLDGRREYPSEVVERRLLADRHPAADEVLRQRELLEVSQGMGLAAAEIPRDQHALMPVSGQQVPEGLFDHLLIGSQQPNREGIRHAVAQCFEGLSAVQPRSVANRVGSGAVAHGDDSISPMRTNAATGLACSRSRTSSITRVRNAS